MIRRVLKLLGSLRFTLFLILSLSVVFLLGLWIPQKGLIKLDLYLQWKAKAPAVVSVLDALGLTSIYTSPVTLTLWMLFFLNLSLVMWQRVSVVRNKITLSAGTIGDAITASPYHHNAALQLTADRGIDAVRRVLHDEGYRFYGNPERFYAVKNRFSPLATLLFHLSFFLILLGGAISVYTRFAGTVDLAEGEVFRGEMSHYNPVPRLPKIGKGPALQFTVEKIEPEMIQGTHTGLRVTLVDSRGVQRIAEINRPYKADNTSFVIQSLGVAPLVILRDRQGREMDGAYIKLNVLRGKQDVFAMAGLEFTVDFFPDYFVQSGREGTRSEEIKNPVFRMNIAKDKVFLARKMIRPGESTRFGEYRLEFREMPYWVRFYVVKERGLWVLYTGFAVAALALIWRLVFYRREIAGMQHYENGCNELHLAGRAEFYKTLFEDEFGHVIRRIRASEAGETR